MSCLFQNKGVWYLVYVINGKRVWKSTKIKVANDPIGKIAKQVQRDFDSAEAKSVAGIIDKRISLPDAFRAWLNSKVTVGETWAKQSKVSAKAWEKFLDDRNVKWIDEIDASHIQEWIVTRKKDGMSLKTIKTDLGVIKGMIKHINRSRKVSPINTADWPSISRTPTATPERIGAYTAQEVNELLEHLQKWKRRQHWYFPVLVLAYTGCRFGEMLKLRVSDFLDKGLIRVESHKTATGTHDQIRHVEIHPRIKEEFVPTLKYRRSSEPIFPEIGKHNDLDRVILRACTKLNIQYRRVHGLRHFFITELIRNGAPLPVVQRLAGHNDIRTTMRYCDLLDGDHGGWVGRIG
ncbi:MAG: site-specific integrase [Candidatus Riflebacteria bacterium]|nr:site-specific integrase [Candidatus Riflebacteria bacterium]